MSRDERTRVGSRGVGGACRSAQVGMGFQTCHAAAKLPCPRCPTPVCFFTNQSLGASTQKEGQTELGENHGFRALKQLA